MFHSRTKISKLSERFNGSSHNYWVEGNQLFLCGPEYRGVEGQNLAVIQASWGYVLKGKNDILYCLPKWKRFGNEQSNCNNNI